MEASDPFAKHETFILDQNNCPLCGTKLEITCSTDIEYGEVEEIAHCPQCQMRTRSKVHSLN